MHRGLHPVVPGANAVDWGVAAVDVLHDVGFAAGRPWIDGDVVPQHPEGRPHSLGFRQHHAGFDSSVLEAEEALRFEARRSVDGAGGVLRDDVEVAVGGADVRIGAGGIAGAGG